MIKVNEYVRTKDRVIGKAIKVLSNRVFLDNLGYAVLIKDIVKHSKQLIDLIEVGDYVNGHRVVNEIWGEDDNNLYFEIEGGFNKAQYIGEKDIQTILTEESYMAKCYKVGGLYGRNQ